MTLVAPLFATVRFTDNNSVSWQQVVKLWTRRRTKATGLMTTVPLHGPNYPLDVDDDDFD
jgi:hypothetical protein